MAEARGHIDGTGDRSFAVVLPFVHVNNELLACLESMRALEARDAFSFVLVRNGAPASAADRARIASALGDVPFELLAYAGRRGPSPTWIHGARACRAGFVCLIASDCVVDPTWAAAVAAAVSGQDAFFSGNYAETVGGGLFNRVERRIDAFRFEHDILDFRNFVVRRDLLLRIVDEYFRGAFCTDAELTWLNLSTLRLPVVRLGAARVRNRHATSLPSFLRRKWRHGVAFGRILRRFPYVRSGGRERDTSMSMSRQYIRQALREAQSPAEMLIVVATEAAMYAGGVFGFLAPAAVGRRTYVFHFDEPTES